MRILITGGTGFIGQHLLDQLTQTDHSIRVISRKDKPAFWCMNKKFEIMKADLADKDSLEKAMEGVDIVVNLAAELKEKSNFAAANIDGVKNLIELSKKNKVTRFIHLSSVGVVGKQFSAAEKIIDENTVCHPKNEYERTKLVSEKLLTEAFADEKLKLFILRPTNVFGDQHPRKALLNFLTKIKNDSKIMFTKNAMVNYVYVKDLTACISYFLTADEKEQVFNVGHAMRMEDFCSVNFELLNKARTFRKIPAVFLRMPALVGYFGSKSIRSKIRALSNGISYTDARLVSKWNYPYGNLEGLKRTIAYYKATGNL